MAGYKITPEALMAAAIACVDTNEDIQGQLANLRNYVINLQLRWRGMAANAFALLMADYDRHARMLGQALADPNDSIASALRHTAMVYEETENANVSHITQTGGYLPTVKL